MLLEPTLFLHGVNLVTGPGSGSGKTTFAKAAALSVHCAGHTLALVSVGLEGMGGLRQGRQNAAGRTSGPPREAPKTDGQSKMSAGAGDVFVTAEAYLGSSHCMPEILDLVPGSSAVGRLVIARARRSGNIALAGPECNEHLAWIVRRIQEEGWADTIVIDGALNRITQVAFLPGARLYYAVRADRSNYIAMTRKMRYLLHLAELPQYTEGEVLHVAGPLTQYVLDNIPKGTESIVVRDFSKVFMDEAEFLHAERDFRIMVAEKLMFGGFAVSLKGILQGEFIRALGNDAGRYLISMDVCAGMQ